MKKFWEKHRVTVFAVIGALAFVGFVVLSAVSENINKSLTTESLVDTKVLKSSLPNDEHAIVIIGLTYCGHCHNFNPIITKISNEYELPLYWFDIDVLSEDDATELRDMFSSHGYEGSSPYIAVLNKGEVVTTHVGEMTKTATISFLKEAGTIK